MKVKGTNLNDLKKMQLIWDGHVKRMSDETLQKIAFNYKTSKTMKSGTPRKKMMDNTKKAMRDSLYTNTILITSLQI